MANERIEEILNRMGAEEVPPDVEKLAEDTAREFRQQKAEPVGIGRVLKIAVAAAVVFVVIGGFGFWPDNPNDQRWWLGPSSVWAQEILDRLTGIEAVVYRKRIAYAGEDGEFQYKAGWERCYNTKEMYRRESYRDDLTLGNVQWVLPDGDGLRMVEVSHTFKCWFEKRDEAYGFVENPVEYLRERVESLLEKADRKIEEKNFDGRACVGFEIEAYKYGDYMTGRFDRIWFDQETKLPVRVERNGYPLSEGGEMTHSLISDQYEYLTEIHPDLFEPKIPEGYVNAEPDEIRSGKKKEEKVDPPAAWEEKIYEKLDEARMLFSHQHTVIVDAAGNSNSDTGWALYYESDNRVRIDLQDNNGTLVSTRWILANEDPVRNVTVSHELECYHETDETGPGHNPRKNLKDYVRYMSGFADLDLGEDLVDEKPCIGFEYTATNHGDETGRRLDRMWYDRETRLPVRFEMRGMRDDQSGATWDMIYSYQYFDEIPEGIFDIVIPDGFINAHPDEVRKKSESESQDR